MTEDHNFNSADLEYLAHLSKSGDSWRDEVSNRDIALGILSPDYEAQLIAIRDLLWSNREAEEEQVARLRELEELGRAQPSERIADDRIDQLHGITYQDATHSMAAIGLLAPFVESMFVHVFRHIESEAKKQHPPPNTHERWQHSAEDQWDCRFVWKKGRRQRDVVRGILQLADALGMTLNLPGDLRKTLSALFAYRNKMFHWGLEWPLDERERFVNRIRDERWVTWFSRAESGDHPWIIYMSRDFVDHCLDTIDRTIDGIGAYCRDKP